MSSFAWRIQRPRASSVAVALVAFIAALLAAAALQSSPAQAADCSESVAVSVDQDTCATHLAVSGTGNAKSSGDCTDVVSCIAVSGTGSSKAGTASDAGVPADSSCGGWQGGGLSNPASVGCVAVSGTGDAATAANGGNTCGRRSNITAGAGCLALSGTGDASNQTNGSGACGGGTTSITVGCVAVSGGGDASNAASNTSDQCDYAATALFVGCVAVSGAGNASNSLPGSCAWNGFGNGSRVLRVACVAASGTGSASNTVGGNCAGAHNMELTVGCLALTGTGSATNNVSGACGTGTAPDPLGVVDWVTNIPNDLLSPVFGAPSVGGVAVGCQAIGPLPY